MSDKAELFYRYIVLAVTARKVSVFGVFWSVFSPNAGKYDQKNSKYGDFLRSK